MGKPNVKWSEEFGIEMPADSTEALIWLTIIFSNPKHIYYDPKHWDYGFVKGAINEVLTTAYPGLFRGWMN